MPGSSHMAVSVLQAVPCSAAFNRLHDTHHTGTKQQAPAAHVPSPSLAPPLPLTSCSSRYSYMPPANLASGRLPMSRTTWQQQWQQGAGQGGRVVTVRRAQHDALYWRMCLWHCTCSTAQLQL